jgi:2,6-dihydroxypyridine 3-monooxygenase
LWYRNVPAGPGLDALMTDRDGVVREVSLGAGAVREANLAALQRDAAGQLPPPLVELVHATPQPFLQAIMDCEARRMAFGRIGLIGDAAWVARPHAAAGTAKAAEDGWQLAQALQSSGGDVVAALQGWERRQLALGRSVLERTRAAGRRAQVDNTWRIGDPLPFGLYSIGDSEMA